MLLIDYLAKLATEEKIRLHEEERKKAADQPGMEQRTGYYIGRIYKRKRSPRDVEYVIKNTPEGRVVKYPKKKSDSGTDFDEGQQPIRDEPFNMKNVKSRKDVYYEGPIPAPGLAEKVREQICERAREKGGVFDEKNEAILVIQKVLTVSDVTGQQNRITIPVNKMNPDGFLNADEEAFLDTSEGKHCNRMLVDIIEPSGTVKVVHLSKWKMQKERGKPSVSYIVNGEWKDIVLNNRLEAGKVVQLWAARINEELCLAFVIL